MDGWRWTTETSSSWPPDPLWPPMIWALISTSSLYCRCASVEARCWNLCQVFGIGRYITTLGRRKLDIHSMNLMCLPFMFRALESKIQAIYDFFR